MQAQASSGRWGHAVALRYAADDSSGSVALHLVVYAGADVVAHASTGQRALTLHSLNWQAPKSHDARAYRFCVTASDHAGNRSAQSCAPIALS